VTNSYGSYVAALTGSGTVANEYGFYCANLTKGTNKYPIYIANNLGKNYIGADTQIAQLFRVGGSAQLTLGGTATNAYPEINYNFDPVTNTRIAADICSGMLWGASNITFRAAPTGLAGGTPTFTELIKIQTTGASLGALYPAVDATYKLGISGLGWSEVFAANGTINISDARKKTNVKPLDNREIAAAKDLAKEVGAFKFLDSIAKKGEFARTHIGMTVQRAMEIMQSHGLDPLAYGLICYDKWDDEFVDHPAVYHQTTNEDDEVVQGEIKDPAWREQTRKAGDSYGFRSDQLALFILRGLEARLSALEEK
jgi:hypothetical protein